MQGALLQCPEDLAEKDRMMLLCDSMPRCVSKFQKVYGNEPTSFCEHSATTIRPKLSNTLFGKALLRGHTPLFYPIFISHAKMYFSVV